MKSNLLTMTLSLTAIACCMGAALGLVHQCTAEPIARQQEALRLSSLEEVLPLPEGAYFQEPVEITVEGDNRPVALYQAITPDERTIGAAVQTWTAEGFAGDITVMAGIDADGRITGYKVLQSGETPGLGDKASYWFQAEAPVDGSDGASGATSRHSRSIIGTSKPLKVAKDGGTVDGITAATITSRAFLDAINRARKAWDAHKSASVQPKTETIETVNQ